MALRIIYGRAGSGKSYTCLNEIKQKLSEVEDTPLILIVPEQYSLQAEKNLVQVTGKGGIMRADVISFRRMAFRVFNEVGGLSKVHINNAGKNMILYKTVEAIKAGLKVFDKSAKQPGFINKLSTLIAELKRYEASSKALNIFLNELEDGTFLKNKLQDLITIYEEYEKNLHERYSDSEDELSILAQKLEISKQFDNSHIWIDEFSGFTPQEYRIIQNLLNKAKNVTITLCTDKINTSDAPDASDIFSPLNYTARKLISYAKANNIAVLEALYLKGEKGILPRYKNSSELSHIEQNLFAFPYKKYEEKTKDINIFVASNLYSEVEETAREIIRLVRDDGYRYKDITVVTRDITKYEKLFAMVFSQYNLPFFLDIKRDISSHPLILLVNSVFEIFSKNWSYETVFRYLKTGLVNIDTNNIDILENYVLAFGIRGAKWTQSEDWSFTADRLNMFEKEEDKEAFLENINRSRKSLVEPLVQFRSKTKGRKIGREICTALFELLCNIGIPEKVEELVNAFRASNQLDLANEYSQIWNLMMELFDQIVEVLGEETLTIEKFANVLIIGLNDYKTGLIPPALDQVLVGSIERSKSHAVKALFILGVNDGVFPSTNIEEGILSDRDREQLRVKGVELAQDTRSKAFEEQFMIYSALCTSEKNLRLSYPIANHEGKSMRPSLIINRVKKLFPNITESSNVIMHNTDEENLGMISAPIPVFNYMSENFRRSKEGFDVNNLWWDAFNWYKQNNSWKEKCEVISAASNYSNIAERLDAETIKKLYGSNIYTSISRLEKYSNCAFSYFIQYGLKAKEREVFRLNAPDVGTFIHKVIDEVSLKIQNEHLNWRDISKAWLEESVSNIVDQLLMGSNNNILNSSARYRYLSSRLKRILSRAVLLIAEHIKRSDFNPIGYEVGFGKNEDFTPISIELPGGGELLLNGRIDRLDALEKEEGTYLRIIDYKSGSKDFKLSDVYYGLQIQLIIYLDAIWENGINGNEKPVLPGGVLYFKIDDPMIKSTCPMSEEDIEQAIKKQLKMKGLLLADVNLIRSMDNNLEGDSDIIPARINKGDVLGRSSTATLEQFNDLRKHVKRLLGKLGQEIFEGNTAINPIKKGKSKACEYCSFGSICQFDTKVKDNKFTYINELKDDEVWVKISE